MESKTNQLKGEELFPVPFPVPLIALDPSYRFHCVVTLDSEATQAAFTSL